MNASEPSVISAQRDLAGFLTGELGGGTGAFDEMFDATGRPRADWLTFLESIERLGRDELVVRAENGRRILREHGVSYIAAGDSKSPERFWELDFLPLVIGAGEWSGIEAGVIQRAELLNGVLRDLFGTQRLVRDGFIPAPLVYANPGYLRACQAVQVPGGNYLHTYAVDLARAADGQWWVLADRTQAPTGMGFALENRTVVSRVLPEAMAVVQPRPLSTVLHARREAMCRLAPQNRDNPSIVLLTPGPRNEAYFEHAYLARLMGFTLVEGGDLTVRDRAVFIKTLDGLQRADVILRRVSDVFCDPLELRTDSLLGVPGLVEATRAGQVAVVNALGAGLLESPGFLPFLPGLSRHLLGEELRLPTIATWWCGQAREYAHVLDRSAELAIRSAFSLSDAPVRPGRLPESQRAALLANVRLRPHEFVGQELVPLSRMPVLHQRTWEQRPIVLRVFALFDGERYVVMPGGLARVVDQDQLASQALSPGGGSKDVWVLGEDARRDEVVNITAPLNLAGRAALSLPSRTADNFFWLGRYTERLEQMARISRCVIGRLTDEFGVLESARPGALSQLLERLKLTPALAPGKPAREHLQREVIALWNERGRAAGARELFQRIHLAAFSVRDRLSADTWRILNRLESDARFSGGHLPLVHASSVLNTLVLDLAAFSGMEMENMNRGQGWTFLDCGRRIERGTNLVELLRAALSCTEDLDLLLEPVLEISDSVMTHRRRYFADLRTQGVLELLLSDRGNPRSFAFQLAQLAAHAAELPQGVNPEGAQRVQQAIEALRQQAFAAAALRQAGAAELAAQLERLESGLAEISELLTQVYFSHTVPRVN
jgi:uncharacterized circularly permuted ATP-grasp superfamily protein/uncharacterized alpha-E superfamily protein